MVEIVSTVFKGLVDIPDVPMTPTTARSLADLAHSPRLQVSPDSHQGPILNPFTSSAGAIVVLPSLDVCVVLLQLIVLG